jgi:hypothetical protein
VRPLIRGIMTELLQSFDIEGARYTGWCGIGSGGGGGLTQIACGTCNHFFYFLDEILPEIDGCEDW